MTIAVKRNKSKLQQLLYHSCVRMRIVGMEVVACHPYLNSRSRDVVEHAVREDSRFQRELPVRPLPGLSLRH